MEKDLEKAYFGIVLHDFNSGEFKETNLFNSIRVLRSIALLRTKKYFIDKYKTVNEVIGFCFGDTRGRTEYEFIVSPWVGKGEAEKVDTYRMYVLPNKKLLYDMVMNFSVASCRRVLKKYK